MSRMRWIVAACVFGLAAPVAASTINIEPGAYTGRYFVDSEEFVNAPAILDLADGTYAIDTGASSGGSAFTFTVTAGVIVAVSNTESATFSGNTLTLQTTAVSINPGAYVGRYFMSSHNFDVIGSGGFTGPQTINLVSGLQYWIDDGSEVSGSSFLFTVTGGAVTNISPAAATASGATIYFTTVGVSINPAAYTGLYYLTSNLQYQYFSGPQTLQLIANLVYGVDNYSSLGGSAFYFSVGSGGNVATTSQAATASGNVLTFLNVLVQVDPGGYPGVYRVGGYTNLSGAAQVTLIPTLLTSVAAGTVSSAITPGFSGVTPTSLSLVVSGQPYTFTFGALTIGAATVQVAGLPVGAGTQSSLNNKLSAAQNQIQRGNPTAAANQLTAFLNQLNALVQSGQVAAVDAAPLIAEIQAIIGQL